MTRNTQVFVAPGEEDAPLRIKPSPWHRRRWVRLPFEHWALILDFAKGIDPVQADALERLSDVGASQVQGQSREELRAAADFVRSLQALLPSAPPLVERSTPSIPEDHPNEEHARMCDAVAAVMSAAAEATQPIRSWVE